MPGYPFLQYQFTPSILSLIYPQYQFNLATKRRLQWKLFQIDVSVVMLQCVQLSLTIAFTVMYFYQFLL